MTPIPAVKGYEPRFRYRAPWAPAQTFLDRFWARLFNYAKAIPPVMPVSMEWRTSEVETETVKDVLFHHCSCVHVPSGALYFVSVSGPIDGIQDRFAAACQEAAFILTSEPDNLEVSTDQH